MMNCFIRAIITLGLFCLLDCTLQNVDATCIHDIVQPRSIQQKHINYDQSSKWISDTQKHSKRATKSLYQPIRIHIHFSALSNELHTEEEEKLQRVVSQTANKISQILSGKVAHI